MNIKKIKYTCPICKKQSETTEWRFKRKKTKFCKNCVTIGTQKGIKRPQFSNNKSGRWNGGEYISSDGYKMVKCENKFHPSGRTKYKKEHIIIFEKELGRELKTERGNMGEQIHHIDGDKLNNNIENLEFCKDAREHRNFHCQLEEIAYELVRKNIIIFDKKDKKYKINECRIT